MSGSVRTSRIRRGLPTPVGHGLLLVALLLLAVPDALAARVVRVIVERREVILDGREWGPHGAYEKLVGRILFEWDPDDPANRRIVDLDLAARNEDGRVEAWADFMVLQPRDRGRRRGVGWLEVSNRGGKASLRYFHSATGRGWDPTEPEDFGDGLLFRQGLTLIWVGWQGDLPEREGLLRLHLPEPGERLSTVEGPVRADWVVDEPVDTLRLGHRGHVSWSPVGRTHPDHVLTVRSGRETPRDTVPAERWTLVAAPGDPPGSLTAITLEGGFEAGRIYELVYRAREPRPVGVGLVAIRDVMSYAKYGLRAEFPVSTGVAFGVSQTGRFLRHFLYQGFNVDEGGHKVFDGMLIHTAGAGRGSFNHRFAQPSRDAHRYSAFFYPTDLFPFTSRSLTDPVTGREEGLLDSLPEAMRPRVFYTNTGYEYWGRAASLLHTTPDGLHDVMPLPRERVYHLAGGQHFVGGFPPAATPAGQESEDASDGGPPLYRGNPLDFLPTLRALSIRLIEWVTDDVEPPPSRHPTLAAGTLVPPGGLAMPPVPGLQPPAVAHVAYRADYGPEFRSRGIVTRQPPALDAPFPSLVSQVDGLGNEMAGIRNVELRVPLATYVPWNLRGPEAPDQPRELTDFLGTFVPLPVTEERRREWGDPRPSLEALYGSRATYMRRVVAAVQELLGEELLLPEDAGRVSARAAEAWDWWTRGTELAPGTEEGPGG